MLTDSLGAQSTDPSRDACVPAEGSGHLCRPSPTSQGQQEGKKA